MKNTSMPAGARSGKRVLAISVTTALAITGAAFGASSAQAASPLASTPDLSQAGISSWAQATGGHYDFEGTTLPGSTVKALRMSNWVDNTVNYGGLAQLHTPNVAPAGPRIAGGADYDTFVANFTVSAADYATQPNLAIEISPDTDGNRAGGDLLLREEPGQKLTLTNFHIKSDSTTDEGGDWTASTASIDFTGPVAIKYVAQFDADANKDVVKVYVNGASTPIWTGSTFMKYHAIEGDENQTVDGLSFRAVARQVDESQPDEAAWTTQTPTEDQLTALKGKGFYFSKLSYGVSNTAAANPIRFAVPSIAGVVSVGHTLTAQTDTDDLTNVNFAYQWLRGGKAISGATASTYKLTPADYGTAVSVKVTASKPGYVSSTRTSAATIRVPRGTLEQSTPVAVSGIARVGSKLTAIGATTPAATYTYQWTAGGVAISGATASTYVPVVGDLGKAIAVVVKSATAGYSTLSTTSDPTTSVTKGVLTVSAPVLSGTAKVGGTLTAKVTASPRSLLRYSFYADGDLVQLSTSSTLDVTYDLSGLDITVQVSAFRDGYLTAGSTLSAAKHIA